MGNTLPLTGERTVPGIPEENYWYRRHEAVYRALAPRCVGTTVLEAGCGEGYGADVLAGAGAQVVALDLDRGAAAHVGRRYPRVAVARANLVALPVRDGACGAVVSLQVLEHLWDQELFLRECARVLAPGGVLLLSTPNRLTFTPGRDAPRNPFHTRELGAAELAGLLVGAGFTRVAIGGLHHGPRLRALDAQHGGSLADALVALVGHPWPERLRRDVASVTADDFVLHDRDVDASLDLVAVALTGRAQPR
jgi:SAM-dependent methyltransferase